MLQRLPLRLRRLKYRHPLLVQHRHASAVQCQQRAAHVFRGLHQPSYQLLRADVRPSLQSRTFSSVSPPTAQPQPTTSHSPSSTPAAEPGVLQFTVKTKKHAFDTQLIKQRTLQMLELLHCSHYDLSVTFATNAALRKLNALHRQIDAPTDILSFPPQVVDTDKHILGEPPPPLYDTYDLGEIVVSVEYAVKQAKELGCSLEERLTVLLAHGLCHLLGYDHEDQTEYTLMQQREDQLLAALGVPSHAGR